MLASQLIAVGKARSPAEPFVFLGGRDHPKAAALRPNFMPPCVRRNPGTPPA
jgi:hypothetical protein